MERVRGGMLKASAAQAPPVAHNGIRPTLRPHRTTGWRCDSREPAEGLPYAGSVSIARLAIAPRKHADAITVTSRSTQGACCMSAACKPPRCGAAAPLAVCWLFAGGRWRTFSAWRTRHHRDVPRAACRAEATPAAPQRTSSAASATDTRVGRSLLARWHCIVAELSRFFGAETAFLLLGFMARLTEFSAGSVLANQSEQRHRRNPIRIRNHLYSAIFKQAPSIMYAKKVG